MWIHGTPEHPDPRAERPRPACQSVFVNDSDEVWLRPHVAWPTDSMVRDREVRCASDVEKRSAAHAPPLYAGSSYGGG
jgi:hypothetical protein